MSGSPLVELLSRAADGAARPPDDATSTRILDAALVEAAAVGLQRVTVEDVVRRAGVGRMTAYRRFPKRTDLVQALMAREAQRFLAAVAGGIARATDPRDGAVEAFVAAVRFAREHPMLRRVGETDPGAFTEIVAADGARILRMGSLFIARQIHGGAAGAPSRDTVRVGDVCARLFVTYVAIPPTDPDPASEPQLRRFARDVLAPMIERASPGWAG